ncbi:MAG: TetR/AcrR family transcriptional regulator [Pseudomonadota bacterium]|nr:TetR/AcrR family transcriptional regulator [Pseudomonadota bacterium]
MNKGPDTRTRILDVAVPLFAAAGYEGASMRAIARAVGIQAASLYNHFPDKQSLYLGAMAHAFADKARGISEAARARGTPQERLERFIERFTQLMAEDPDFRMLLQRELLDGDETRLQLVAEQVFREPFEAVSELAQALDPSCDPHMLAISMAGLVLFHFETAPVRRFLPGVRDEHDSPNVIARHVKRLLLRMLGTSP